MIIMLVLFALSSPIWVLLIYLFLIPIPPHNFYLRTVALIIIFSGLGISYIYYVHNVDAAWERTGRARVRLVFAAISLLIILAFTLSEYTRYRDRLAVRDVCLQFDQAIAQGEYDTAYELMSPNYRQTHSLVQFKAERGSRGCLGTRPNTQHLVVLYFGGEAGVMNYPIAPSLNTMILFEKVNRQWYLTGKVKGIQG
jgi:hypothetical protein